MLDLTCDYYWNLNSYNGVAYKILHPDNDNETTHHSRCFKAKSEHFLCHILGLIIDANRDRLVTEDKS